MVGRAVDRILSILGWQSIILTLFTYSLAISSLILIGIQMFSIWRARGSLPISPVMYGCEHWYIVLYPFRLIVQICA